jgi:acetyl-CoA carboxylase biotin carboxyl carrier protein
MSAKLTHEDVREILALLETSTFDELSIEMDDLKLVLRRSGTGDADVSTGTSSGGVAMSAPPPPPAPAPRPAPSASPQQPTPAAPRPAGLREVAAPMLGIFYRAPKPGAEPFVSVGARIAADSVIGIIEVMKLMNPVPAGIAGEVIEVIAPDGELVEFGQTILLVKPD